MIGYEAFVALSQSSSSEDRAQAAHLAASAYLGHHGRPDEQAALYAALIGFLDDSSVKVRAALAYGLLHSEVAPRPVILALLDDSPVISRAVVQYSPVLVDADLVKRLPGFDLPLRLAVSQRERLSRRLAEAILSHGDDPLVVRITRRHDVDLGADLLARLAARYSDMAEMRGALLARPDLPGEVRLVLVRAVAEALRGARIVKGAIAGERLDRIMRVHAETAVAAIGEQDSAAEAPRFASSLIQNDEVTARLLLHAVVSGHVLFFSQCIAELTGLARPKVLTLLEQGSRASLRALFARCGLGEAVRGLFVRLVLHARAVDLVDDPATRHYVVTALTEELLEEHQGNIPTELEEAFNYLTEQNIALARQAARGVMAAFASAMASAMPEPEPARLLPAA